MAYQHVQSSHSGNPPPDGRKGTRRVRRQGWWEKGISEGERGAGVFPRLHGKQDEERHHQTEQTHSLRQSKSQDGIGEELLLQGGVPVEDRGMSG